MKKLLIYMVLMVCLVGIVSAWYEPNNYWKLNSDLLDANGVSNLHASTETYINGNHLGSSFLINANHIGNLTGDFSAGGVRTLDMWFNITTNGNDQYLFVIGTGNIVGDWLLVQTNNNGDLQIKYTPCGINSVTNDYAPNNMNHLVITIDSANGLNMSLNNTELYSSAGCTTAIPSNYNSIIFGRRYDEALNMIGSVDNIFLTNSSYTPDNITASYNNGAGLDLLIVPPGITDDEIQVTLLSPPDNNINVSPFIDFVYNFTPTAEIDNCSLWLNNTGSWTLNTTQTDMKQLYVEQDADSYHTTHTQDVSAFYDNDFDTQYSKRENIMNISFNYTKPAKALNTSLIEFRSNNRSNYTIHQGCFDLQPIQFRVWRGGGIGWFEAGLECYNSTDWQVITNTTATDSIYEESMWWDTSGDTFEDIILYDGDYIWNVNCMNESNSSFAPSNFTITIDTDNASLVYDLTVGELQQTTITLTLNTSLGIASSSSIVYYNAIGYNTTKTTINPYTDKYTVTLTTPTDDNGNFTFFYNITTNSDTFIQDNVSGQQTITDIGIDNCDNYGEVAVNFSFKEAETKAAMTANMSGYFQVYIASEQVFKPFNLSWVASQTAGICINLNTTYQTYAQFIYETANSEYAKKTYYFTNASLDNDTDFIDLYLTANTSLVTFTVSDQNDKEIEDVYIHILRYDFGTNSHVTTEILKTDELGQAIGNIILNTQWYKFILYYNDVAVFNSEPVKITSTSRNFRINTLADYFSHYDIINEFATSLTFTNSTRNFAFTFSSPTGVSKTACLEVIERGVLGDNLINKSCLTSSSGTILVNIGTDVAGKTYLAMGTISGSPIGFTDFYIQSFYDGYKKWGKDGLFLAFIVRLALAMIGLWNPIVALVLIALADVGFIVLGLFTMSWDVLMIYLVMIGITMYRVSKK